MGQGPTVGKIGLTVRRFHKSKRDSCPLLPGPTDESFICSIQA